MIRRFFLFFSIVFSVSAFSQEFSGCGEYHFKGILKYDEKAPLKMSYIIHEGSLSQMIFYLVDKEDINMLAAVTEKPSQFKAKIVKKMDGTKGELRSPTEIALRFPDPLRSSDTGIAKIKNLKCR